MQVKWNIEIFTFLNFLKQVLWHQKSMTYGWIQWIKIHHLKLQVKDFRNCVHFCCLRPFTSPKIVTPNRLAHWTHCDIWPNSKWVLKKGVYLIWKPLSEYIYFNFLKSPELIQSIDFFKNVNFSPSNMGRNPAEENQWRTFWKADTEYLNLLECSKDHFAVFHDGFDLRNPDISEM